MSGGSEPRRLVVDAECYTPPLLRDFLLDLEGTTHSVEVWRLIVRLGITVRNSDGLLVCLLRELG